MFLPLLSFFSYWDSNFDFELMNDSVAVNLLYVQTVAEVEKGWIIATRDIKSQLTSFQVSLAKKEYIELAQKMKYYGFLHFTPCYCDYPKPQTKVLIAIGDQELNMRVLGPGQMVKEGVFKVTRMRCWRITATHVSIHSFLLLGFHLISHSFLNKLIRINNSAFPVYTYTDQNKIYFCTVKKLFWNKWAMLLKNVVFKHILMHLKLSSFLICNVHLETRTILY